MFFSELLLRINKIKDNEQEMSDVIYEALVDCLSFDISQDNFICIDEIIHSLIQAYTQCYIEENDLEDLIGKELEAGRTSDVILQTQRDAELFYINHYKKITHDDEAITPDWLDAPIPKELLKRLVKLFAEHDKYVKSRLRQIYENTH